MKIYFGKCKIPGCNSVPETEILGYYFCFAHGAELNIEITKTFENWFYLLTIQMKKSVK